MSLSIIDELLSDTEDTTGTISHTTASFTPPNDSLLVVHCGIVNGAGSGDVRTGMVLSGGGLIWTLRLGPNGGTTSGYTSAHEIWTAPVGTASSMTLTYSHSGNVGDDRSIAMIQVQSFTSDTDAAGFDGTPNTANGPHDQGDGPNTINLGSASASASYVAASRYYSSNGSDRFAQANSAWTESYDDKSDAGGYGSLQSQWRTSSTSTSVIWDDLAAGGPVTAWNSTCLAIEIEEVAVIGGANPKGPLGMPLHGPFAGPIG